MSNTRWLKHHEGEYFALEYLVDVWVQENGSSSYVRAIFSGASGTQSLSPLLATPEEAQRLLDRIMLEFLETETPLIDVLELLEKLRMEPV